MAQSKENATASLVAIHTHTDGRADVIVTGTYGQLTLNISADGPCIGIRDPERGELRYKAVAALKANGRLEGWFVAHKGATPQEDTEEITNQGEPRLPFFLPFSSPTRFSGTLFPRAEL
jgi:hypothetical protein